MADPDKDLLDRLRALKPAMVVALPGYVRGPRFRMRSTLPAHAPGTCEE